MVGIIENKQRYFDNKIYEKEWICCNFSYAHYPTNCNLQRASFYKFLRILSLHYFLINVKLYYLQNLKLIGPKQNTTLNIILEIRN